MKPYQHSGPSTFQPLSQITERLLASRNVIASASTEDAKERCDTEDERLADAAWFDFLAAHLPKAVDARRDRSSAP
jgi:hypothetical protein